MTIQEDFNDVANGRDEPAPLSSGEALTRAFEEKLTALVLAEGAWARASDAIGKPERGTSNVSPRERERQAWLNYHEARAAVLALYREALADREAMRDALDEARQKAADMEAAWHCAEDELDRNFAARAHQEDRE